MNWNSRYSITDPGRQQHSQGRHIINTIKENFGEGHELGSRMIDMIEANHRKDYPDCARCSDDRTGRLRSPYRQNGR